MTPPYGIDLTAFELTSLQDFLAHGDLLPSHLALREGLDRHFAVLAKQGLMQVQQLVDALTTKKAVERFAAQTGIPVDYLTLLRRHVRGYIPNPINFADIPGMDEDVLKRLTEAGITHTKQLFERARTRTNRSALQAQTGIDAAAMRELIELTDLSRIGWVGPIGVRLFHQAGAHTADILASFDPDTFYARMSEVNRERQYTRAVITRRDVGLIIDIAKKMPDVIEY